MKTLWHDDDTFWEMFAPAMFTAEAWTRAPAEVDGVLSRTGVQPGARVLDIGCGPGRHVLELARRGFRVTGIDRTRSFLLQAREAVAREDVDVELVEADARSFRRPGAFDLALSLFTSFGYYEDPDDDRRVVAGAYEDLAPRGVFVLELMSKEIVATIFRERDWREIDDGSFLLEERKVADGWSWMQSRWILVRDGAVHERTVSHRLYGGAELRALLLDVGFADVALFGSLDGAPYDRQAQRLVVVARK